VGKDFSPQKKKKGNSWINPSIRVLKYLFKVFHQRISSILNLTNLLSTLKLSLHWLLKGCLIGRLIFTFYYTCCLSFNLQVLIICPWQRFFEARTFLFPNKFRLVLLNYFMLLCLCYWLYLIHFWNYLSFRCASVRTLGTKF